jgi:hypothetical protein
MKFQRCLLLLTTVAVVGSTACTKTLGVVVERPGAVAMYGAQHLVLVESEGRKQARDVVSQALSRRVPAGFAVEDRGPQGVQLTIAGNKATDNDAKDLTLRDAYIRADVVEWDVEIDEVEDRVGGAPVLVKVRKAEVVLQMSIVDANGGLLMNQQEVRSEFYQPRRPGDRRVDPDDELLFHAAEKAVDGFYAGLIPVRVSYQLRLDETDNGQSAVLDRLNDAPVPQLIKTQRTYVTSNPQNAVAHYNLAVLLDANANYDEALSEYDIAMGIQARDYYNSTKAGCQERKRFYEMMHVPAGTVAPAAQPGPGMAPPLPLEPSS